MRYWRPRPASPRQAKPESVSSESFLSTWCSPCIRSVSGRGAGAFQARRTADGPRCCATSASRAEGADVASPRDTSRSIARCGRAVPPGRSDRFPRWFSVPQTLSAHCARLDSGKREPRARWTCCRHWAALPKGETHMGTADTLTRPTVTAPSAGPAGDRSQQIVVPEQHVVGGQRRHGRA